MKPQSKQASLTPSPFRQKSDFVQKLKQNVHENREELGINVFHEPKEKPLNGLAAYKSDPQSLYPQLLQKFDGQRRYHSSGKKNRRNILNYNASAKGYSLFLMGSNWDEILKKEKHNKQVGNDEKMKLQNDVDDSLFKDDQIRVLANMEPQNEKQAFDFGEDEDFEVTKQLFAQTSKENFFSAPKTEIKMASSYTKGFRSTGGMGTRKINSFLTPDLGLHSYKISPVLREEKLLNSRGNTISRGESSSNNDKKGKTPEEFLNNHKEMMIKKYGGNLVTSTNTFIPHLRLKNDKTAKEKLEKAKKRQEIQKYEMAFYVNGSNKNKQNKLPNIAWNLETVMDKIQL